MPSPRAIRSPESAELIAPVRTRARRTVAAYGRAADFLAERRRDSARLAFCADTRPE